MKDLPETTSRLSEMVMYSLIYVSIATKPFSAAELVDLLKHARRNNEKAEVTGMLLYKEGNFMQALEGEERRLRRCRKNRPRSAAPQNDHDAGRPAGCSANFRTGRWDSVISMRRKTADLPGYSEFMNTPLTADAFTDNPTRAQRLLRVFKRPDAAAIHARTMQASSSAVDVRIWRLLLAVACSAHSISCRRSFCRSRWRR